MRYLLPFLVLIATTCSSKSKIPTRPTKTKPVAEVAPVKPVPKIIPNYPKSVDIVPKPVEVTQGEGAFVIDANTKILHEGKTSARAAKFLAEILTDSTALDLQLRAGTPKPQSISFIESNPGSDNNEAYKLEITKEQILITAASYEGFVHAIQSMRQLMLPELLKAGGTKERVALGAVEILDYPRFKWRGLHLDVCRHFVSKEFIKKFIDTLSFHKMNTFHWHLTEDQAWRIEIKKYPKLTEIGAWRPGTGFGLDPKSTTHYNEKGQYGGYYSQEDIKEIIAHATERGVTIVPEIELPGHALAALSAYPHFGCTGGPYKMLMRAGISRDVYCAGNDETLAFLEDVLNEVADLFPGTYFHIGGDECPKQSWKACPKCQKRIKDNNLHNEHELQSWVIKWAEKILAKKGKRLIGWDEILEGGLAENAAVMSWRGTRGGIKAASMGHNVVMSPTSHCYLDYKQAAQGEPRSMGGRTLTMQHVYSFEPIPNNLPADKVKHILGAQGNLWTEYMPNEKSVEYMAYPRACAISELTWSPKEHRNWDDFSGRMGMHYARLGALDVNARIPFDLTIDEARPGTATITTTMSNARIYYTLDGKEPTSNSTPYTTPIVASKMTLLRAIAVLPGGKSSAEQQKVLLMPKLTVTTSMPIHRNNVVKNIVDGSSTNIFWSSRSPSPNDHVTLTFENSIELKSVRVITGKVNGGDELENGIVEVSADGTTFTQAATFEKGIATGTTQGAVKIIRIKPTKTQKNWLVIREVIFK